jgi:hypothetical protein
VYAEFHLLVETVIQKWTLAPQIDVAMEHVVLQVSIIKTFIAHVQSDTLEDFAMKISTSANYRLLHAETVQPAKIQTDLINVYVQKDMKERIAL